MHTAPGHYLWPLRKLHLDLVRLVRFLERPRLLVRQPERQCADRVLEMRNLLGAYLGPHDPAPLTLPLKGIVVRLDAGCARVRDDGVDDAEV